VLANSSGEVFAIHRSADPRGKSVTMIWPRLRQGVWRFEVLPGGDGASSLSGRTFTATALDQPR
jgi:hypothetical protein